MKLLCELRETLPKIALHLKSSHSYNPVCHIEVVDTILLSVCMLYSVILFLSTNLWYFDNTSISNPMTFTSHNQLLDLFISSTCSNWNFKFKHSIFHHNYSSSHMCIYTWVLFLSLPPQTIPPTHCFIPRVSIIKIIRTITYGVFTMRQAHFTCKLYTSQHSSEVGTIITPLTDENWGTER